MIIHSSYAYTIESSIGFYKNEENENIEYLTSHWEEAGRFVAISLE